MLKARRAAVAFSVAGLLALAPASAFASGGGVNSGGVNAGGVNAGGGGGGGGGGGSTTSTPPAAPSSCANITSFSNSTGYYSVWAAIWTPFSISNSCSTPVNWEMSYTNGNTGAVDFVRSSSTAYMSSGTIDEDWAAFSTPYTVSLTVTDPNTGAVLASRSALVTTKVPKTSGA
jgi:hypothetical protein